MRIKTTNITVSRALFIFILTALPASSQAAVTINEVMYDPAGSDTKAEWLELYNDGASAVDLSKWTITDGAKGTSGSLTKHALNVPPKNGGVGSITIGPGAYLIVADDAVTFAAANPLVANVIDTAISMPNTGGSLQLIDDTGGVADTFTYAADQYGDKGNSLQRGGTGELVSALPTPAAANATENYTPPATETASSTTSTYHPGTTPAHDSGYIAPPLPLVFADAGPDRTVIAGADVEFDAGAYDRNRQYFDHARFSWNFGDGGVADGARVLHHFGYPGLYAVTLTIANERLSTSDRVTITVEPAQLAFSILPHGGVSIQNRSGHDLDLSLWRVQQGGSTFSLPTNSVVLVGSSLNITADTLGFPAVEAAELHYPNGDLVLHAGQSTAPAASSTPAATPAASSATTSTPAAASVGADSTPTPPANSAPAPLLEHAAQDTAPAVPVSSAVSSTDLSAAAAVSGASFPLWASLLALAAMLAAGIAAAWYLRPSQASLQEPETSPRAEEFSIE